jgi:hypothetical protein
MNNGEPTNLLDRPELPELSLNGAELSVNGSSPHIDDQPPTPPADRDGYRMKHYHVEVILETGEWTDGWACGRCEDAELMVGKIVLSLSVEAHTDADALTKAVTAARTAIHNAGSATRRFGPTQLKLLAGDERMEKQLLRDRKPPVPWTLLSPAEIERYKRGEMDLPRWSSGDGDGGDCWAVTVVSVEMIFPPEQQTTVRHGCWLSASGSGS